MKQKGICMKRIIYITIACAFLSVSFAKAQQIRTLKDCLEEGLQNNYSLRIVHNEEQISKNNATLGNAGYLPTLDFSAGYTGNLDNIETKARATGEITKNTGIDKTTVLTTVEAFMATNATNGDKLTSLTIEETITTYGNSGMMGKPSGGMPPRGGRP